MIDRFTLSQRRALPGMGPRKKALYEEIRVLDREITHYIIAFVAGKDPEHDRLRDVADAHRARLEAEFMACTKEIK